MTQDPRPQDRAASRQRAPGSSDSPLLTVHDTITCDTLAALLVERRYLAELAAAATGRPAADILAQAEQAAGTAHSGHAPVPPRGQVLPLRYPREHCGGMRPGPTGDERTECVLRPGHQGSHADLGGMRWLRTDQGHEAGEGEVPALAGP